MDEAEILDYLTTQGIDYEYQRHPAVLTMDEAERLALPTRNARHGICLCARAGRTGISC